MSKNNYLGVTVFLVLGGFLAYLSGNFFMFVNLPAMVAVVLGAVGAVLLADKPQQTTARRLQAAATGAWLSGLIMSITGFIMVLANLSDPQSIGPNLAVALTSVLYGATVRMFCKLLTLHQA